MTGLRCSRFALPGTQKICLGLMPGDVTCLESSNLAVCSRDPKEVLVNSRGHQQFVHYLGQASPGFTRLTLCDA
jgi:hypothetical protein